MKKVTLIMVTLIISMSLVNADETPTGQPTPTGQATPIGQETPTVENGSGKSDMKKMREEEFKRLREEEKARIEANREKMKENREEFKGERGTGTLVKLNLTDDQKAKIKEIMDAHKAKMDEYKKAFEAKEITREELITKVEELRVATNESLKTLLGDNEEALRVLSLKKVMLDKNMEIRKENLDTRKDFKNQREELRMKYKEKYVKAIGSRLDKMDAEKLNLILTKIDAAIVKANANTKLSQTNKDKILAQLEALKAIINDKLGVTEETTDVNVEDLLQ